MKTLISAEQLAAELASRHDIRVIDVRWVLGGPPGLGEYLAGHIPGAAYADLDTELAAHGEPADGRHPLPSRETLQGAVRRWGVNPGDTVVVYDGAGNLSAARAWWLLKDAGIVDVLLLDGALPAWRAAGLPLAEGPEQIVPGSITLSAGAMPVLDADGAAAMASSGLLLDARAGARYRGDTEPIDPKAGHIPGARSAPTAENLAADGRFLSPDELRSRFEAMGAGAGRGFEAGAGQVGVYCGSGVTAAHEAVALVLAGYEPVLYPGSWSQWSNLPDRPVETGDAPA